MYLEDTFFRAYILKGTNSLGFFLAPECSKPYIYSLKTYLHATNKFSKANDICLASESTDFCLEEVVSKPQFLWQNFLSKRRTLF